MKKIFVLVLSLLVFATGAWAADFVNGGFESGNVNGWTEGAGSWAASPSQLTWPIDPGLYLPGGTKYDLSYQRSAIVTPGADPIVGAALNRVYSGNYAYRANDQFDSYDYSIGVIKQSVTNYDGTHIYFAWAAVLQNSHGATDSDNLTIKLINSDTGAVLYSEQYSSFSRGGIFNQAGDWYWTPWQVEDISVAQGGNYTLMLLAADCGQGGHAGYAYLDGFGAAPPPVGTPEPATMLLLGLGLVGIAGFRKRS